jgi:hypothetical protein
VVLLLLFWLNSLDIVVLLLSHQGSKECYEHSYEDKSFPTMEYIAYRLSRQKLNQIFRLAPMGFLAPGYAHARPSAWPPSKLAAQMSTESPSNITPTP